MRANKFVLIRRFRRELGTTPHHYLVRLRIERARACLGDGMPLAEVAAKFCFADQGHFSRAFKSVVGMAPGRYARTARGQFSIKTRGASGDMTSSANGIAMTNEASATQAVQSVVARVAHHIDARRWEDLRALYADMVETDYTSLFGGEVVDQRADDLVLGTWRTALTPLDATHHLLGPITVELRGDTAIADCHVRAVHLASRAKSGTEWTVAGHYVFELTRSPSGWKIRRMKLETSYQTGNAKLLQEASAQ